MADRVVSDLSKSDHAELCCTYAALMLHDDGLQVTGEKLNQVFKTSGNHVEPYWPILFAKALGSANIDELLSNVAVLAAEPAVIVDEDVIPVVDPQPVDVSVPEPAPANLMGLFGDSDEYGDEY